MNSNNASGVRAVIFDISGTIMDWGSRGPVAAFVELFARHGVNISEAEARVPMGLHKRDHVRAVLQAPAARARWKAAHGSAPDESSIDAMYGGFGALQIEVLKRHLDLIPGTAETSAGLRQRGIRIATTTGFETAMLADIVPAAEQQGFQPDFWVCPDQCGGGRPAPWMIHHAARQLGVYPLRAFVKVGDTLADIEEAHNAGTWAVSVVKSGNEIGLSRAEWDTLARKDQEQLLAAARAKFERHGAHYVIDTVADLLPAVDEISRRIAKGERP